MSTSDSSLPYVNTSANVGPAAADDLNETTLSFDLRIMCFAGLFILSIISSLFGNALLFAGRITGFCVMVSIGSIFSLFGTMFLMGPSRQIKKMLERGRLISSSLYFISIILTLVAGLVLSKPLLALFFIICQYIAMFWYSLSYIPMAQ